MTFNNFINAQQSLMPSDSPTFNSLTLNSSLTATNLFSSDTALYSSTYSTGTITWSGTTLTGSGTTFTSSMVGGLIYITDGGSQGSTGIITGFTSATSLTMSSSHSIGSAAHFIIYYNGISLTGGVIGISNSNLYGSPIWQNAQTFTSVTLSNTTNQLILGTTNTTTISSTAPSSSRTYTISDQGQNSNFYLRKVFSASGGGTIIMNTTYYLTATQIITWTLPTTLNQGDWVEFRIDDNGGQITIAQPTGVTIIVNSQKTSTGVPGNIVLSNQGSSIRLEVITANTKLIATNISGTVTIN